jgi:hypothetical protein
VNLVLTQDFASVICTWLAGLGDDPLTYARVLDGQAFCSRCGATDHEVVKD